MDNQTLRIGSIFRQNRLLLAELLEKEKVAAISHANEAVSRYETTLASLVGLHREAWQPWDWKRVEESAPPEEPAYPSVREPGARAALDAYTPSLADRVLQRDVARHVALTAAVDAAREADRKSFIAALEAYAVALARWEWHKKLAADVLAGDARAYEAVLSYLSPFGHLRHVFGNITMKIVHPLCVEASFVVRGLDAVPAVVPFVKKSGALATRPLSPTARLSLHRDHVASASLRMGRELFGLLPIELAIVHARGRLLNRATGHEELVPLLSVALSRGAMGRLRFETLEPFAALDSFFHRVAFRPRVGFGPVQTLTVDELRSAFGRGRDPREMMLGV